MDNGLQGQLPLGRGIRGAVQGEPPSDGRHEDAVHREERGDGVDLFFRVLKAASTAAFALMPPRSTTVQGNSGCIANPWLGRFPSGAMG